MQIRRANETDKSEWLRMRSALWPDCPDDHPIEIDHLLADATGEFTVLIALNDQGQHCGFIEAGMRSYAEGCTSSPVAYVEGWWVDPDDRAHGVGRALIAAVEDWARDLNLTEIASDADLDNNDSIGAHLALGYQEVERIVCFRKSL